MSDRSIAVPTVRGTVYSIASSGVTIVLGFLRSVLLARLLSQEAFGITTLALFFLNLSNQVGSFGLSGALIHRKDRLEEAIPTHFVLSLGMAGVTFSLVLLSTPILLRIYREQSQMVGVLIAFAALDFFKAINGTPQTLLQKELDFGYLAVMDVVSSIVMTIGAPLAAWAGLGYWSLVLERAVGVTTRTAMLWVIRRPWTLRWGFDRSMARWFLRFGSFIFLSRGLTFLLDQFDDFWTGTTLGPTSLGYYSRAYEFARYPRRAIANPVMSVLFPTFAKVQDNRLKLSQAFYRVLSLIVRLGFVFAGAFALVTPEFIRIFLGERWLPMAFTFRLMLIYTLLDPILNAAGQLTVAVGEPRARTSAKLLQLLFFVPAVIVGAALWGMDGVAVAADLMLVVGMVGLFPRLRRWVDFSLRNLLLYPTLALALGLGGGMIVGHWLPIQSDWISMMGKLSAMIIPYGLTLLLFEREEYRRNVQLILRLLRRTESPSPAQ